MRENSKFKINKKEVEHVAKLARLGLSEAEIEKMQKELSKILDYIEKLKEVDVSEIPPTSHSILIENIMRKDEVENEEFEVKSSKLMELAPEKKDSYLKVKKII